MPTLIVAALAALYFACFVGYGVNLEDEGLILFQIARTAWGERPYVDFHTGYTPGTFYLNAWLLQIGGGSVLPIRAVLVVVNAATVGLVFALARPLAGTALAATAALGYAAFLPCFVGDFASFNVPYPSWYAGLFFLGVQAAVDRWVTRGERWSLVAAGVLVGASFTFKPNAGILAVLAAGIVIAMQYAGRADADRRGACGLLVAALAAILAAFGFRLWLPELWLIATPVMLLLVGRLAWARGSTGAAGRLWPSIALLAAGALLVTVPWMIGVVRQLGVLGFVREVLLLGSDADVVYATPYPIPLGFPASWPALAALGLLAVGLLGVAIERGRVRADLTLGGLGVTALLSVVLLVRWARVPEGLVRSVTWQVQHIGFYALPFMGAAVAVVFLRRLRPDRVTLRAREQRLLAALVFTLCMYVMLYPRVDTMHLIIAMPAGLVLSAAVAGRLADVWARVLAVPPSATRAVLVAGGMLLSLIACAPNFAGLAVARQAGPSGGVVQVDSPFLPIRVEALRGTDLRAFNATLAHLRARLEPGEPIFAFPALSLFAFALGHPTPAPHDYFFPGRPDHLAEAEIVRDVAAARPRFVVTLNRRLGFFSEAPAYYFMVRAYLRAHYELAARFGRYDVLRRRGDEGEQRAAAVIETFEPPPLPSGGPLAGLADPDREQRRRTTLAWLDEAAGAPPESVVPADDATGLLLMRNLAEVSDARGLPIAYAVYRTASWRLKNEAAGALNFLALRDVLGRHLIAPDVAAEARVLPAGLSALDPEPLRRTLEDQKKRLETGAFASWALRSLQAPAAEGSFEIMLRDEPKRPYFRVEAAKGLVALGRDAHVCTLVHLLRLRKHEVQNTVPSFLIETAQERPDAVARCLAEGLRAEATLERETAAWIAGAASLSATAPALRGALGDEEAVVRAAAAWALGRLGDVAAGPALAALAGDEDEHVRGFAGEALAHLEGGGR